MATKQFNPVTTALLNGINLIEASAGTGKTYAIAMLVLRFVVERDIPIDRLLVVTFTKAATEELKVRIRSRLSQAQKALDSGTANLDQNLTNWLATLTVEKSLAKQRLQFALLDIDQAGIFTIHGFCQRVLKEYALESGQLFDSELTGNIDAIRQACADDFWRKQIYPRNVQEAAILTAEFNTPEDLLASIKAIPAYANVYPDIENLDEQLKAFNAIIDNAKEHLHDNFFNINAAFVDDKFKADFQNAFEATFQQITDWLQGQIAIMPTLESINMLSSEGLKLGLNGNKFRTTKSQSSDERKQEYLDALNINTSPFDAMVAGIQQINLNFRRTLAAYLQDHLGQHLQQLNTLSFDQLITCLAEVLKGEKGQLLTTELQARFSVALIDEFQDTDQAQWHIFSTLFSSPKQHLYLIGDPKQAIYKFRGADIFSYFAAQNKAEHNFTLGKNWRSYPSLVDAVNILFSYRTAPFRFDQMNFTPVAPALKAEDGMLQRQKKTLAPMTLWQLPNSESANGHWTSRKAAAEFEIAVTNEILQLLDGETELSFNNITRPVKPADIAILVRSNAQARDYQSILQQAEIPAVLNSTESVFNTQEAQDLFILLQAVAHPGNLKYLKLALALDWFNLSGQQLYQILNDETEFDAKLNQFQSYYQQWLSRGLMTMMQDLLTQQNIQQSIAKNHNAERQLTNLHHLIELLQQTVLDERLGIAKTLDWLASAINTKGHSEEQQLRLESDAKAVKIVTMHRAKGLEYPIVFCPYLWQNNTRLAIEKHLVKCHDKQTLIVDLGSEKFSQHREQAVIEELAEDIRLFYVAVTRAQYRCYITWANVRSKEKTNSSAMSYLLFSGEGENAQTAQLNTDFSSQQNTLQTLCRKAPKSMQYELLEIPGTIQSSYKKTIKTKRLLARKQQRVLASTWQMSSYTALSSLSQHDAPELPIDKARELQNPATETEELLIPKGAHTGNVIHELLEITSFKTLKAGADIDKQRDAACLRYGLQCSEPNAINNLLKQVVQTSLSTEDPAFTLANIEDQHCLKEMPFYLSIRNINVQRINKILKGSHTFQPLSAKQLSGFLTGFIDLICQYQGRFYVMDYKSNWLPNYQYENLIAAMREHNYGLQYWLYSLVLHNYLQNRLPDYDYQQHFGGVRYLFVRGMEKEQPMSGVYQDRPELKKLEELGNLF